MNTTFTEKSNADTSSRTIRMNNSWAKDLHLRQAAPSNAITKDDGVKNDVFETFFADLVIKEGNPRERGSKVRAWLRMALDRLKDSTYDEEDLDDELNDSIHLARTRFEMEDSFDHDETDELKDSIHLTAKRLVKNEEKWQQVLNNDLLQSSNERGEMEVPIEKLAGCGPERVHNSRQKHHRQPLARAA